MKYNLVKDLTIMKILLCIEKTNALNLNCSITSISRDTIITYSHVFKVVNFLITKNFITMNDYNNRTKAITLTELGIKYVSHAKLIMEMEEKRNE
jgi:predicted transcriptional regulator